MGFSVSFLKCGGKPELENEVIFQSRIDTISYEFIDNLIPPNILNKLQNNEKMKQMKNPRTKDMKNILFNDEKQDENIKNIYYKGEMNDQYQKHGLGELLIIDKNDKIWVYFGNWENDEIKHGQIFYSNGDEYSGDIKNFLRDGKGVFKSDLETYDGEWKEDRKEGAGEVKYKNNTKYKGEFKDDKYYDGNIYYPDGTYYSGKFDNNLFDGEGFLEGCNKHSYNGGFKKGKFHGYGEFKWIEGGFYKEEYHGEYCNGKKEGQGKFIFNNKDNSFEGSWKSGLPNGEGVFITNNRKYYCIWRKGIFTQLLKYEEKEGCEEENVEFNFKTPIEDIIIPDQIGISLASNFSYRSVLINGSEEML